MPVLNANGIRIAYDTAGDPHAIPMLLIMGLGMQLVSWPDELVEGLAEAGFHVIRFDNRDSGLSSKFDAAGAPSLPLTYLKHLLHWPQKSPYTLDDMAADALGLMSALGIGKAHVVGASMGGMIAQLMSARHPERVLSLTSIMSSSGRRGLPGPTRAARAAILGRPADPGNLDSMIEQGLRVFRAIGSPAYPTPEKQLRERITRALKRSVCLGGVARQMVAIAASGDRGPLLAGISARTLVIHGAADPLVPLACGQDTARRIPDARLEVIEGMGHDLPPQLIERLIALIDAHAHGKMSPNSTARLFEKQ